MRAAWGRSWTGRAGPEDATETHTRLLLDQAAAHWQTRRPVGELWPSQRPWVEPAERWLTPCTCRRSEGPWRLLTVLRDFSHTCLRDSASYRFLHTDPFNLQRFSFPVNCNLSTSSHSTRLLL